MTTDFRGFGPAGNPYRRPPEPPSPPYGRGRIGAAPRSIDRQVAQQVQGPPQQPRAQELQSYQESAFVGPLWKNYMEEMANVFGRALGSDVDIKIANPEKFGGVVKAVTELKQNWQSQGLDEVQAGNAAFDTIFETMLPGVTYNSNAVAPGFNFKLAEDPLKAAFPPPKPKTQFENLADVISRGPLRSRAGSAGDAHYGSPEMQAEFARAVQELANPLTPTVPESFVGDAGGFNRVARQTLRDMSSPASVSLTGAFPAATQAGAQALRQMAERGVAPRALKLAAKFIDDGTYERALRYEAQGEAGAQLLVNAALEQGMEPNLAGQIALGLLGGVGGIGGPALARQTGRSAAGAIDPLKNINLNNIAGADPRSPGRVQVDRFRNTLDDPEGEIRRDPSFWDNIQEAQERRMAAARGVDPSGAAFPERMLTERERDHLRTVGVSEEGLVDLDDPDFVLAQDPDRAAANWTQQSSEPLLAREHQVWDEDRTPAEIESLISRDGQYKVEEVLETREGYQLPTREFEVSEKRALGEWKPVALFELSLEPEWNPGGGPLYHRNNLGTANRPRLSRYQTPYNYNLDIQGIDEFGNLLGYGESIPAVQGGAARENIQGFERLNQLGYDGLVQIIEKIADRTPNMVGVRGYRIHGSRNVLAGSTNDIHRMARKKAADEAGGLRTPDFRAYNKQSQALGPATTIIKNFEDLRAGLRQTFREHSDEQIDAAVEVIRARAELVSNYSYRQFGQQPSGRRDFPNQMSPIWTPEEWLRRRFAGFDPSGLVMMDEGNLASTSAASGVEASTFHWPSKIKTHNGTIMHAIRAYISGHRGRTLGPVEEKTLVKQVETMWHELGHVIRKDIWDIDPDAYKVLRRWAGMPDLPSGARPEEFDKWTFEAEEKFARGFVSYLANPEGFNRQGLTKQILDSFRHVLEWLRRVALHDPDKGGTQGLETLSEIEFRAFDEIFYNRRLDDPNTGDDWVPRPASLFTGRYDETDRYLGIDEDSLDRPPYRGGPPTPRDQTPINQALEEVLFGEPDVHPLDLDVPPDPLRDPEFTGVEPGTPSPTGRTGVVMFDTPDGIGRRVPVRGDAGTLEPFETLPDTYVTLREVRLPDADARQLSDNLVYEVNVKLPYVEGAPNDVAFENVGYIGLRRIPRDRALGHNSAKMWELHYREENTGLFPDELGILADEIEQQNPRVERIVNRPAPGDPFDPDYMNPQREFAVTGRYGSDRGRPLALDEPYRAAGYAIPITYGEARGLEIQPAMPARRLSQDEFYVTRNNHMAYVVRENGEDIALVGLTYREGSIRRDEASRRGRARTVRPGTWDIEVEPITKDLTSAQINNIAQIIRSTRPRINDIAGLPGPALENEFNRSFLRTSGDEAMDEANPYGQANADIVVPEDRTAQALEAARRRRGYGDPSSPVDVEIEKRAWQGRVVPFEVSSRLLKDHITPRMINVVRERGRSAAETVRLRHEEAKRNVARGAGVLGSGRQTGEDAARRSTSVTFPAGSRPVSDTPFMSIREGAPDAAEQTLSEADIHMIFEWINRNPKMRQATKVNTMRAVWKLIDGERVTPFDLHRLREVFGKEVTAGLFDTRGFKRKAFDEIMDILQIPRLLLATLDFSAPLRQGLLSLGGHPVRWAKTTAPAFRAALSGRYFDEQTARRQNHKNYELFTGSRDRGGFGLHQTDPDGPMSGREEAFMSRFLQSLPDRSGKIPVIGQKVKPLVRGLGQVMGYPIRFSDRGYNSFLNELRFNLMNDAWENWKASGKGFNRDGTPTPQTIRDGQQLARWFNISTGRGELGALEPLAPAMANILFSPRLAAARLQTPVELFRPDHSMRVKQHIVRDVAGTTTIGTTVLGLAALAGADVDMDPTSSDFGRIQIGNTRLDIWGGFQPLVRTFFRMAQRRRKSTGTGASRDLSVSDLSDEFWSFWRNKLAPVPGLGVDAIQGGTFTGDDINFEQDNLAETAFNRLAPLMIQDIRESFKEDGLTGVALAAPSFFGTSVISYQGVEELARRDYKYPEGHANEGMQSDRGLTNLTDPNHSMFDDLPPFLQDHAIYLNKFETARESTEFSQQIEEIDKVYWESLVGIASDPETSDSVKVSQYFDAGNTRADQRAGAFQAKYGAFEGSDEDPKDDNEKALQQYYTMINDSINRDHSFDTDYFNRTFDELAGTDEVDGVWTDEQEEWVRANTNTKMIPKVMYDLLPDKQKNAIRKSEEARISLIVKWAKEPGAVVDEIAARRPSVEGTRSDIEAGQLEVDKQRNINREEAGLPPYTSTETSTEPESSATTGSKWPPYKGWFSKKGTATPTPVAVDR